MKKARLHQELKNIGYDIVDRKFVKNDTETQNIVNLYRFFLSTGGNYQETYKYYVSHFSTGQDTLYKYLRDTSYIGKYKLYRKNEYIDNYCPRIMDDNLFYSVQNLLHKKEKTSKKTNSIALFSNLIYCSECNSLMYKKQDNRTKNRLIRYVCDNAFRYRINSLEKKCTNSELIREDDIEKYLLNNIKELAKSYIRSNTIKKVEPNKDNSSEKSKLEHKINKLKDLYLEDLIDKETYRKDYEILNKKLQEIKNVKEIKKDFSNLQKLINLDIEQIYSKLTLEEKRLFWVSIIEKIYINHREIKGVTFL